MCPAHWWRKVLWEHQDWPAKRQRNRLHVQGPLGALWGSCLGGKRLHMAHGVDRLWLHRIWAPGTHLGAPWHQKAFSRERRFRVGEWVPAPAPAMPGDHSEAERQRSSGGRGCGAGKGQEKVEKQREPEADGSPPRARGRSRAWAAPVGSCLGALPTHLLQLLPSPHWPPSTRPPAHMQGSEARLSEGPPPPSADDVARVAVLRGQLGRVSE